MLFNMTNTQEKIEKKFVDNEVLSLKTIMEGNKVTGFEVVYKGLTKKFDVKRFNMLEAWKKVEVWLKDIR
jgi:uncharacterized protein (DUF2344 family)